MIVDEGSKGGWSFFDLISFFGDGEFLYEFIEYFDVGGVFGGSYFIGFCVIWLKCWKNVVEIREDV